MVPVRAAGFVIFRRVTDQIEYLLMQASYGDHHWTPPKGHVDPGESDIETAWRETQEEAGLTKNDLKIVDGFKKETHYNVKDRPKVVTYWCAELIANTPVTISHEHQDFKWVPCDTACDLAKYLEMKEIILECHAFITASKAAS